jgi:hypothetical protein
MKNQLEIEIGDTVRISDTSQYYRHQDNDNPRCEGVCIKVKGNWCYRVIWSNGETNSYNMGDLILIKKGKTMKEFTKSDLIKLAQTETVFVKQREGMYMLVLRDRAVGDIAFSLFCDIRENLLANKYEHLDIVAVYKASDIRCLNAHLKGESLTSIWERIEQTPAQKEMEALQAQIDKGAAYMAELHEQAKRLQAKL